MTPTNATVTPPEVRLPTGQGMADARPALPPRSARAAFTAAAAFVLLLAGPRSALAWRTSIDGTGRATDDFWNTVAFHPSGDPIVAGVSIIAASDFDCVYTVARLSRATGEIVWRNDRPDCGSDETVGRAAGERVLVDPSGDVIVGRRSIDPDRAFYVTKYSGDTGDQLWFDRVGSFPKEGPAVHTTALDGDGNVLFGAGIGVGCETSLVVAKLDATTGRELWRKTLVGTFTPNDQCDDEAFNRATGVAADADGDVLATGVLYDGPKPTKRHPSPRATTHPIAMKLSGADGSEMWRVASEGASRFGDPSTTVALDEHGNLVQLGDGFTILKRSGTTGDLLWRYKWPLTGTYDDVQQLAIAANGDVAAAGLRYPDASPNHPGRTTIGTVLLDGATGGEAWRHEVDPGTPLSSVPRGLALDESENLLVVGAIENSAKQFDFLLAKLGAADGAEAWRIAIDGSATAEPLSEQYTSAFHYDDAAGLAIDGGVACAVGSLLNAVTGQDAIALLAGADGSETWRSTTSGHARAVESARAVAVLPGDDVVATGDLKAETGASRFTVRRLASDTGAVVWGADLGNGSGTAIAADGAGDVVAAGTWGGQGNVAVFKLDGATGGKQWRFLRRKYRETYGRSAPLGLAANGDVFLAALLPHPGGRDDTFVFRLAAGSGAQVWRRKIPQRQTYSLAVDSHDDVVVLATGDASNSALIKLDGTTGKKKWTAKTSFYSDSDLQVAPSGDVVLAGRFEPVKNLLVIGVADLVGGTGATRWVHASGYAYDIVRAAVTPSGDVIETANILATDPTGHGFLAVDVARLDATTGTPAWSTRLEDPTFADCGAGALASDHAGNALIGGCSISGYSPRIDFAVTVLAFANGAPLWQRNIDGSVPFHFESADLRPVQAVTVDSQDNVVAVGTTSDNPAQQLDFTVVKWSAP